MRQVLPRGGIGLVDCERDRFAEALQHLRQIAVGAVISLRPSTKKMICEAVFSAISA